MHYRGLFIGLTTVDIQYFVDDFPRSNLKVKTTAPEILVGGPATNAAVAFSYLNNGAHLVSSVGQNPFSEYIRSDFEQTNIDFTDFSEGKNNLPVLASVITSKNGERNIFTHNPPEIQPNTSLERLFTNVKPHILLLDGFYPGAGVEAAQLARSAAIPVVMDCGSWKPQYEQLLPFTDVAICSEDFLPPACKNSDDVFRFLRQAGISKAAISRGERSLLFRDGEEHGEIGVRIDPEVEDTLGAGDFLHGAFCFYYLRSGKFAAALEKAAGLATFTCRFKGTRSWLKKSFDIF